METGAALDLLTLPGEGGAAGGDFLFEIFNGRDVLGDDRLINKRPKGFGRRQLGTIRRQINEANPIWDFEIRRPRPSRLAEPAG